MKSKMNLYGRGLSLQIAITLTCSIGFIFFGYDQGVFSGIVTDPDFLRQFHHPTGALEGIIVSIYNLGGVLGCIVAFTFGEKLGRRWCIWLAMAFIIIGAVLQCTSYSRAQLFVARLVTGVGTGLETSTVPMYQSELCDPQTRGRLVSSEPLFVGVGIIIAYFFDYGMSFVPGSVAWRVPIAFQCFFAFIVIFLVLGIPESPRFLFNHGRDEEAMQVLYDVWDADESSEKVAKIRDDIVGALELERKHGEYRWSQLFKRDDVQTGRRVLLAYGMQFMNQVGGINLVIYYIPTVLRDNVGLTGHLPQLIGGAVNCMFFVGAILPSLALDKLGRRGPMIWGSLGLAICMMFISILLSFRYEPGYSEATGKNTASAAVAFFFLYMLIFGGTANCVPWVYVPEILPLHARSKGTAIGISSNWLWNFVIVMITPTIIDKLKWKAYLIFMCTNLAFIPLVYFCYPETTNLSLEEIDYLFVQPSTKGMKKFTQKSAPVRESLKPRALIQADIEQDGGLGVAGVTSAAAGDHGHADEKFDKNSSGDERIER